MNNMNQDQRMEQYKQELMRQYRRSRSFDSPQIVQDDRRNRPSRQTEKPVEDRRDTVRLPMQSQAGTRAPSENRMHQKNMPSTGGQRSRVPSGNFTYGQRNSATHNERKKNRSNLDSSYAFPPAAGMRNRQTKRTAPVAAMQTDAIIPLAARQDPEMPMPNPSQRFGQETERNRRMEDPALNEVEEMIDAMEGEMEGSRGSNIELASEDPEYPGEQIAPELPIEYSTEVPRPNDAIPPVEPSDQTLEEYYNQNPGRGYLRLEVAMARRAISVQGVEGVVSKTLNGREYVMGRLQTDRSGISETLALPAPERSLSYRPRPNRDQRNPCTGYDLVVSGEGFIPVIIRDIPIFDGIVSIQPVTVQSSTASEQTVSPEVIQETEPEL